MTIRPASDPGAAPWPLAPRRDEVTLAALVAVLFGALAFFGVCQGVSTSTETRYAEMGREMLVSGDWIVPTLNGAPLLEKPPFEYWVNAASFAVFGINDLAARVPSLLAGLLVLLVTAIAARRFAPEGDDPVDRRARGPLALLALVTMPAFLIQAYTISIDVWLVLTTTTAGMCWLESVRTDGRPRLRWTLLLHAAFGVGMLAKGPLTLALVGGSAVIVAIARRDRRPLRPFVHPAGLALFLAISVPWYVAANARLPGLLHDLVTRRVFGGLASSKDFHSHSFWYVWFPLLGTFPWLAALPASGHALLGGGRWRRGPGLPLAVLAASAPVLFTFGRARLASYASPAFPLIALLVVLGWPSPATAADGEASRTRRRELTRATAVMALLALALGGWVFATRHDRAGEIVEAPTAALVVGLAGGAAAALAFALRGGARAGRALFARAALVVAGLLAAMGAAAVTHPAAIDSSKPLWEAIERVRRPGEQLGAMFTYEGDWGLLPWYSREPVRYFAYPSEPMIVRPEAYAPDLFLPGAALEPWLRAGERRFLMLRARDLRDSGKTSELVKFLADVPTYELARAGQYVVVTNLPLPAKGS